MNELLGRVLDAVDFWTVSRRRRRDVHGGPDRWNEYATKVEATIVSGGGFSPLKGVTEDSRPRRMTVWLHEERTSISPYGAPDQRATFTPERVAVEKLDGAVVAERRAPGDMFAGHQMSTPWDAIQRAYFNGEALWTYSYRQTASGCQPGGALTLVDRIAGRFGTC